MCSAWGGGAQKWRSEHWKYFLKKKKNARKKREKENKLISAVKAKQYRRALNSQVST